MTWNILSTKQNEQPSCQCFEKKSLPHFLLHYAVPVRRNKLSYVIISAHKYIRITGIDWFCFDYSNILVYTVPFFKFYMYISSSNAISHHQIYYLPAI